MILTNEVVDELKDPLSLFYLNKGLDTGVIKRVDVDKLEKNQISVKYTLGSGEISCIAFCLKKKKIFVTDDIPAKKKAEKEGITVITTSQLLRDFIKDKDIFNLIKKKFKEHYPKRFANL